MEDSGRAKEAARILVPLKEKYQEAKKWIVLASKALEPALKKQERGEVASIEEYKQALIHQAVTGKIDVRTVESYPKYKDSGVEWLAEVPVHWEVMPIKRIARLNPSKSEVSPALRSADAVFLPMEKVGADGRVDTSIVKRVLELWNGFTYFRQNDVIIAKITPCFENGKGACLTNLPTEIGFGSTEFHVLRPSSAILPGFPYLVTILREFRQLGVEAMTGAAGQQRVPSTFIEQFPTCLPPLPEQTAIVEFLDEQIKRIDAAIAADRRVIELLKEFRTRLVADVVTGKLDVREVAARLPKKPPEEDAESLDEEETTEGDEMAGETDPDRLQGDSFMTGRRGQKYLVSLV
jgi:restriction endonuclease S subunit